MTTLILGVGNLLLGDEGLGVHLAQELQRMNLPDDVDVLDGGTAGMYLMEVLQQYDRVIIIDAAVDRNPIGTVRHFIPKFANEYPPLITVHEIGLKDVIDSMKLLGKCPIIEMITVTVLKFDYLSMEMSPEVVAAIPKIKELLTERTGIKF